jgi:hypothetical protein
MILYQISPSSFLQTENVKGTAKSGSFLATSSYKMQTHKDYRASTSYSGTKSQFPIGVLAIDFVYEDKCLSLSEDNSLLRFAPRGHEGVDDECSKQFSVSNMEFI